MSKISSDQVYSTLQIGVFCQGSIVLRRAFEKVFISYATKLILHSLIGLTLDFNLKWLTLDLNHHAEYCVIHK